MGYWCWLKFVRREMRLGSRRGSAEFVIIRSQKECGVNNKTA